MQTQRPETVNTPQVGNLPNLNLKFMQAIYR